MLETWRFLSINSLPSKDNLQGRCQILLTHPWRKTQHGRGHEYGLVGISKALRTTSDWEIFLVIFLSL